MNDFIGEVPMILEGTCGSRATLDCNGFSVQNHCCEGHLHTGETVGPDVRTCNWKYGNHGVPLQCEKSDEVVAGRCGSGGVATCSNEKSHGILCCELIVIALWL